jgi:type I restriction enzyme S subunit
LNQRVCRLHNFSADVIPEFVFHALQTELQRIHEATAFVTVKHLSSKQIAAIHIAVPDLDEQRRIVALLDRAAEIRRRAEAARDKARAIIPALFLDAFGDPATNPKGWPITTVGELLLDASYGTSRKANDSGEGMPVIRMGNVEFDGSLSTADLKYIELEGLELTNAELRSGDLLFNRTNSKELVGKSGLWDGRFDAVAASYFIRLRVSSNTCDPVYLWAFMNTSFMKARLFATARGAIGQSNINSKELRAFRVAKPPLEVQHTFAERVRRIGALTTDLQAAVNKAQAIAAALSAEVFGTKPARNEAADLTGIAEAVDRAAAD